MDAIEQRLLHVVSNYTEIQQPEWRLPGATAPASDPAEYKGGHHKIAHSPSPVSLPLLDWQVEAERRMFDLEQKVRAHLKRGRRVATPEGAPRGLAAMETLRRELPNLPDQLRTSTVDLIDTLDTDLDRMLGYTSKRVALTKCPYCKAPSVILHPRNDNVALCADRRCVDDNGDRRSWDRTKGQWQIFGVDDVHEAAAQVK